MPSQMIRGLIEQTVLTSVLLGATYNTGCMEADGLDPAAVET